MINPPTFPVTAKKSADDSELGELQEEEQQSEEPPPNAEQLPAGRDLRIPPTMMFVPLHNQSGDKPPQHTRHY
jgi:hypothetical protein